jgi:hypothetical protein
MSARTHQNKPAKRSTPPTVMGKAVVQCTHAQPVLPVLRNTPATANRMSTSKLQSARRPSTTMCRCIEGGKQPLAETTRSCSHVLPTYTHTARNAGHTLQRFKTHSAIILIDSNASLGPAAATTHNSGTASTNCRTPNSHMRDGTAAYTQQQQQQCPRRQNSSKACNAICSLLSSIHSTSPRANCSCAGLPAAAAAKDPTQQSTHMRLWQLQQTSAAADRNTWQKCSTARTREQALSISTGKYYAHDTQAPLKAARHR